MINEQENTGKILIYQNEKGDPKIDVYFEADSIWMTQRSMADLYQVDVRTINEHVVNIINTESLCNFLIFFSGIFFVEFH